MLDVYYLLYAYQSLRINLIKVNSLNPCCCYFGAYIFWVIFESSSLWEFSSREDRWRLKEKNLCFEFICFGLDASSAGLSHKNYLISGVDTLFGNEIIKSVCFKNGIPKVCFPRLTTVYFLLQCSYAWMPRCSNTKTIMTCTTFSFVGGNPLFQMSMFALVFQS